MRFKNIKATNFGCFKDWDSPDIEGNFVVIYGSNESGKTTIFKLVSTLLYGWNPVSENPFIPWDGAAADCSGLMVDNQGQEICIYRRLKGRPEGNLIVNGNRQDLANRSIVQASHVPVDIFNEVYALSIDELCFPHSHIWQDIQNQLLGGQFIKLFNPAGQVAQELKEEAGGLWRHNKQGNARDKQLSQSYSELKIKLQAAIENDECMRRIEVKIAEIEDNIKRLTHKKIEHLEYINRFERLYPVYKKLNKIDQLSALAGNIEEYKLLPENIEDVLFDMEVLSSDLKKEYDENLNRLRKLEQAVNSFTISDKSVYGHAAEIDRLSRSYTQIQEDIKASETIEIEIMRLEERMNIKAGDLLQHGWDDKLSALLTGVDDGELKSAISIYKSLNIKYQQQETLVSSLKIKVRTGKIPAIIPWVSIVMMAAGFAGMMMLKNTPSGTISGLLSIIGGCLMIVYLLLKGNKNDIIELKESEKKLGRILSARDDSHNSIRKCLEGLDIVLSRLDAPDDILLMDVSALKDINYNLYKARMGKKLADDHIRDIRQKAESLMEDCGFLSSADICDNVIKLEDTLSEAKVHFTDASAAESGIDDINNTLVAINDKIVETERKYKLFLEKLGSLEGSCTDEKIMNLKERRKHKQMMLSINEDLEYEHPDLDDIIAEISRGNNYESQFVVDDGYMAKIKLELQEIEKDINVFNERKGSLKKESEDRSSMESPDEIKSCMIDIENERSCVAEERDRLMLLRNVILKAESIYREENQPDVLLKSGKYLDTITGSRYTKIYTGQYDNSINVMSNYSDMPIDIERMSLSRGTREQIYLALRLALASHLDLNGERLPLVFDELFINWDGLRMENAMALFEEIKNERQIFLFTCHKDIAQAFSSKCGAQVIKL